MLVIMLIIMLTVMLIITQVITEGVKSVAKMYFFDYTECSKPLSYLPH